MSRNVEPSSAVDARQWEGGAMFRLSIVRTVVAVAVAVVLGPTSAWALTAEQEAKLLPGDGAPGDRFGGSVAVDGDTAIIGAFGDDDNGAFSGSAYVFIRTGSIWTEQAKLLPADGAALDYFGESVALDGDTTIIGARHNDDNGSDSGSAYVFTRTGEVWTEQAKLLPADGAAGDRFGISVALDDDTAVIGVFFDEDNGDESGSAYVFTRTGDVWTEQAKLLPADGAADDWFGESVALHGDTAVIGTQFDDDNGSDSGSAYVFTRTGDVWTEQAKLLPADGAGGDSFGASVVFDGDTAVIGAQRDDDNGQTSGSAYVFTRSGSVWTEQVKLLPADGAADDWFGWTVSLDGETAIIGAVSDDDNGEDSGSAYVFTRTGSVWTEQVELLAADGASKDFLGWFVALDGDTAVIGAQFDNDNGSDSGSAYVFRLGPMDSDGDGISDDADICPDTAIPESVPTNHLGVNRWALVDEDDVFDTTPAPGGGGGPAFEFTLVDTAGCSCEQIIEAMALGWGHTKFGCSTGAMLQWIAQVGGAELAQPETEATPGGIKTLMEDVDNPSSSLHGAPNDERERQRLIRHRNSRKD